MEKGSTHSLLIATLGGLHLQDDLVSILLARSDLSVEFELDALLLEEPLELLAKISH
jgi:hypothetical protein